MREAPLQTFTTTPTLMKTFWPDHNLHTNHGAETVTRSSVVCRAAGLICCHHLQVNYPSRSVGQQRDESRTGCLVQSHLHRGTVRPRGGRDSLVCFRVLSLWFHCVCVSWVFSLLSSCAPQQPGCSLHTCVQSDSLAPPCHLSSSSPITAAPHLPH